MEQFVALEQVNGHFVAESLAFPELRAEATTEDSAVVKVTVQVRERLRNRKIVRIHVPVGDPMSLAGSVTGEAAEALEEIVKEAYRLRDAEQDAEFPHDNGADYMYSVSSEKESR